MEKYESNDVVAINSDDEGLTSSDVAGKPIIQLFKRLINNDNKQSTVLTNAQIVDILDKEFGINIWDIHELEGEIYLTITKKYLKDWPQWDVFDKVTNNLKGKDNKIALKEMLESNYLNLKDYLRVMLERAQTLAKCTVNKLIEDKSSDAKIVDGKETKSDNVVLEIQSSRNQLNQLFFRRPNPALNDTIFNGIYTEPNQIKVNILSLEAILNWWDVKISIQKGSTCYYERKTTHQLNHVLVNKNLMSRYNPLKVLPQDFQVSSSSKSEKRNSMYTCLRVAWIDKFKFDLPNLEPLFEFIKFDLRLLPEKVFSYTTYRRYTNKYPYVRYLCKDVKNPDINSRKYDLQLEETVSPMYRLYLRPLIQTALTTVAVECTPCSKKFSGEDFIEELKAHFDGCHLNEPDWMCTNCNKKFPMIMLAKSWWTHRC